MTGPADPGASAHTDYKEIDPSHSKGWEEETVHCRRGIAAGGFSRSMDLPRKVPAQKHDLLQSSSVQVSTCRSSTRAAPDPGGSGRRGGYFSPTSTSFGHNPTNGGPTRRGIRAASSAFGPVMPSPKVPRMGSTPGGVLDHGTGFLLRPRLPTKQCHRELFP